MAFLDAGVIDTLLCSGLTLSWGDGAILSAHSLQPARVHVHQGVVLHDVIDQLLCFRLHQEAPPSKGVPPHFQKPFLLCLIPNCQ